MPSSGCPPEPGRVTAGAVRFRGRLLDRLAERELEEVRGEEIGLIFQEPALALHPTRRAVAQVARRRSPATGDPGERPGPRRTDRRLPLRGALFAADGALRPGVARGNAAGGSPGVVLSALKKKRGSCLAHTKGTRGRLARSEGPGLAIGCSIYGARQTRVDGLPPLQLSEQQSPSLRQDSPTSAQAGQAGSMPSQSASAQSVPPPQSLSMPSWQVEFGTSNSGGLPQSLAQEHWSSPGSQVPSPHSGGLPQSTALLVLFSWPSQTRSPQQLGSPPEGVSVHIQLPEVQRESPQPSGLHESPVPQQKRFEGLLLVCPLQSLWQF